MDLPALKQHEGEILELRFSDGFAAIVRLLAARSAASRDLTAVRLRPDYPRQSRPPAS